MSDELYAALANETELMERALDLKGRSLWIDARGRLMKNRAAVVSMVILILIALMAVFAPFLSPYAFDHRITPSSPARPIGGRIARQSATPAARTGSARTIWAAIFSFAFSTARAFRWPSA